jgi:hypothetical protein
MRRVIIEWANTLSAKKRALTTVLTLLLTLPVFANDGTYLTRGGNIYPTKESTISIDREILSFSVQNSICRVDILFEFNNPDNVERKLLVGFQAPFGQGDVPESETYTNRIENFRIVSNGQMLPYSIKAAACEDCPLIDPKDFNSPEAYYSGVLVYLFEITFKPGINKVNHSYSFPASSNVEVDQMYDYILTTGAKWAGGSIKHLAVNFDLGPNRYFYVNDIFGKNAEWSIIGTGKVTNETFDNYDEGKARMIRAISGSLQIDVRNFVPKKNIQFGIISANSFSLYQAGAEPDPFFHILKYFNLDPPHSKEDLRTLRNTIYAQHGYVFKDKDLREYFSSFPWYFPDPNLTMEQIKLTEAERIFIDEILKQEKEH